MQDAATSPNTTHQQGDPDRIVLDGLVGGVLTPLVIERLSRSGLTAINLTAVRIGATFRECIEDLVTVRETIDRNSRHLLIVSCADDVRRAKALGKIGIILGMQDAEPIGRDLFALRALKEIGVRIIQITHNRQSFVGTGCVEPDSGLTRFGRKLVDEMNRLGIVVDLSHCGPQTTLDAIRHSAKPVLITHANPSALCPSPRNKSDEIIRALAERGGVIGIAAWSPLLHRGQKRRPKLSDFMECIDHVIRLVGPAHVGIGTDLCDDLTPTPESWGAVYGPHGQFPEVSGNLGDWYGFETNMAESLDTLEDIPNLVGAVTRRGYPNDVVDKILGGNMMRVVDAALRA
jgi:membrane dipeptidase